MERGILGRLLRSRRVALELTVREIADRLGVSAMTVSNLERGDRVPAREEAIKEVARAYELPVRDVRAAAIESRAARGSVELPMDEAHPAEAETALALARAWRDLTEEDMEEIRKITARRGGARS